MTTANVLTKATLQQLLGRHGFTTDEIAKCGVTHEAMNGVLERYLELREELSEAMSVVSNHLAGIEQVHSTRARMKNPEHLIAKIVQPQNAIRV